MKISVIIPAYNEEKRLPKTLNRIYKYLSKTKADYEILVVDDGSKDRTIEAARKTKNDKTKIISYGRNKGKGYAVKTGMLKADGDYLLFSDADLSTPIEELDKFLKQMKHHDIVIGSRAVKGSDIKIKQPFYRVLLGKTFNLIVQILTIRGIHDTQCGFKLFRKEAAMKIFPKQRIERFGFDVEILFIAKKSGYRIKEMPVVWINDEESKVSPVKDAIRMFRELLTIRYNSLRGRYS